MSKKTCFSLAAACLSCMLLTGCMALGTVTSTEKAAKTVAKGAVKAAIRHSPIAILKAVVK